MGTDYFPLCLLRRWTKDNTAYRVFPQNLSKGPPALCKGVLQMGQGKQEALIEAPQPTISRGWDDPCCLKARCWLGCCFSKQVFKNQERGFTKKQLVTQVIGTSNKTNPCKGISLTRKRLTFKLKKKTAPLIALNTQTDLHNIHLLWQSYWQIGWYFFLFLPKFKCSMKMWKY